MRQSQNLKALLWIWGLDLCPNPQASPFVTYQVLKHRGLSHRTLLLWLTSDSPLLPFSAEASFDLSQPAALNCLSGSTQMWALSVPVWSRSPGSWEPFAATHPINHALTQQVPLWFPSPSLPLWGRPVPRRNAWTQSCSNRKSRDSPETLLAWAHDTCL